MKHKIIYMLLLLSLILGSCNEFLDYHEEDFFAEEDIFKNFAYTNDFLNGVYGKLPTGFNEIGGAMRASASDDAEEANSLENIQVMNDGRWSANRTIDAQWQHLYSGIRSANRLLKNLDVNALNDIRYADDYFELLEQYELFDEQARFLRAYYYFELIKRYGGVPLLDGEILTLEEVNNVQSNTFEEVKNFIVAECDAIIDELPVNYDAYTNGPHEGRATKGAAMALKSRTLLYAASPLHESSQNKWIEAAEAALAVINSDVYSLEGDYSNVVNNSTSSELIMGRRIQPSSGFEKANFPVGYEGADPGTCPTQNLVNTYEMINGMDIDEPGSGYDPQNPYASRDPRLLKTVIVNNSTWKGRNVEIWEGGVDGLPLQHATETGYYLKKYLVQNISLDPDNPSTARHLWVFFRYGEVILNYAEAMNEAYGPNNDSQGFGMTAVDALNTIRSRAGLPDYMGEMTKEAVREEIRDERRVELAFEDHRFWDIRRWDIGSQTTEIKGMKIIQNPDGTFNYSEVIVENRVWDDRMNFYPIPQSELFKNQNLGQNLGW